MRLSRLITLIVLPLAACGTASNNEFVGPNSLMGEEINSRIAQIPFQHREELFNNLVWLAQCGEQAIPALLQGLQNAAPKVRSNCCWVLERIHDRRTIPQLQPLLADSHETVRLEAARSLVLLGDLQPVPLLIEGLDSDKVQVRYLCHEALKSATGRDFNFDHLSENLVVRQKAVLQWRQWWGQQSGDPFFAQTYAKQHNLTHTDPTGMPSTPMMETEAGRGGAGRETGNSWGTPAGGDPSTQGTTTPQGSTTPQGTTTPQGSTTPQGQAAPTQQPQERTGWGWQEQPKGR